MTCEQFYAVAKVISKHHTFWQNRQITVKQLHKTESLRPINPLQKFTLYHQTAAFDRTFILNVYT
uniref:Uncharacterized protein n=2 Tax=Anguilla anguilla TaxID=7936 RepID=A0A0E9XZ13_ANGAN